MGSPCCWREAEYESDKNTEPEKKRREEEAPERSVRLDVEERREERRRGGRILMIRACVLTSNLQQLRWRCTLREFRWEWEMLRTARKEDTTKTPSGARGPNLDIRAPGTCRPGSLG